MLAYVKCLTNRCLLVIHPSPIELTVTGAYTKEYRADLIVYVHFHFHIGISSLPVGLDTVRYHWNLPLAYHARDC